MNKPITTSEAAEGATSAASEPKEPTSEAKPVESGRNVCEPGEEGKPGDGEAAPLVVQDQNLVEEASVPRAQVTGGESVEDVMEAPVRTISDKIVYVDVDALRPHELNVKIYGACLDAEFVKRVEASGFIYTPILITSTNVIISGHRRVAAAKELNIKKIPAVVFYSDDELLIEESLIETNNQRVKTPEQIGREFNVLKEIESKRAKIRMEQGVQPVAQGEQGKSRDLAAKKIGDISGVSAERAGAVVEVIDKLAKSERNKKKVEELHDLLRKNIKGAYNKAVADGHIKVEAKKVGKSAKSKGASKKNGGEQTPGAVGNIPVIIQGYDEAYEALINAENFLGDKLSEKMTQDQKNAWLRVAQHMVKVLSNLGAKTSTK